MRDAYGNDRNTGTSWIGLNWKFERRIDPFPAGFDADGQMWIDTRFGDFPHCMPDQSLRPGESTFTAGCCDPATSAPWRSSAMPSHPASDACDDDPCSFRLAAGTAPGQMLTVDLGGPRTVHSVQVD